MAGDPTSTFPYNCIVLIESPDPSEAGYYLIGSGVVIGPHTILTATHVVYDVSSGLADQNIELYLGWNGADPALGPGAISTTYTDHFNPIAANPAGDLYQWQSASDYAVIDTSYAFTSWMSVALDYPGGTVHVTGYPASAGGDQIDSIGTVSADPDYSVLDYGTLSVQPGNSGGPLWLNDSGSDDVVGIVSTSGWAVQLTEADWSQIEAWVSEDGYSLGAATSLATPTARGTTSAPAASAILFQSGNGEVAVWDMAGASVTGGGIVGLDPGPAWQALGTGDFNGDHQSDILFQNASGGGVAIWEMDGASVTGGGIVGLNPGPAWQALGTGDFNGDHQSDILFQNASGGVAIWEMDGSSVIGGGMVGLNPGPAWQAIGTGDFNGDGRSDILFQNAGDGRVAIWDMNGLSVIGGGVVSADPGPDWRAIGAGAFDGDGRSDILFQNATSGQVAIWEMNGTNVIGGGIVGADPGASWQAIGTGGADILFQSASGATAIWDMNGTSVVGGGAVSLNPGPAWRAVGLT